MINTNSYDCSYDKKPVLEGIMDILRFMDGWTKKIRIGISKSFSSVSKEKKTL